MRHAIDRHETAKIVKAACGPNYGLPDWYKTPCTSAILRFFGIDKNRFKYCQYVFDMVRIFNRDGWRCRPKRAARGKAVKNLNKHVGAGFYLVAIDGHVLLAFVATNGEMGFPVGMTDEYSDWKIESVHRIERKK